MFLLILQNINTNPKEDIKKVKHIRIEYLSKGKKDLFKNKSKYRDSTRAISLKKTKQKGINRKAKNPLRKNRYKNDIFNFQ